MEWLVLGGAVGLSVFYLVASIGRLKIAKAELAASIALGEEIRKGMPKGP